MESIEGPFQIPSFIETSRDSVPTTGEAIYVRRMFRCLSGAAYYVPVPPPLPALDVKLLKRTASEVLCLAAARTVCWYSSSVRSGRPVCHRDYVVLHTSRSK